MSNPFNAADWYWLIGGQVYASARNTYVDAADAAYVAWRTANGTPPAAAAEADVWPAVSRFLPAWLFDGTTFTQPTATTYSRAQLKAYAASARYAKEVGGHAVNGVNYPTDRDTQSKLTAAALFAQVDNTQTFKWKLADGTFTGALTAAQMISIAAAIGGFVNQCFAAEQSVCVHIEDGTIISLPEIDQTFASIS
ncbi:hypothetical protein CWO91_34820 [Bradyrhizobium genosp. SA-3]|uniref:DUF4376 domain-containing protein n=1 Tax=Bradyrhizobium genosp. SA-3 TaxID=508868 RepID=UPI00102A49D6|nr:DUF4376 domain-containing protein [Bradyrhizobium genosp. SA-3]RZM99947.1 hypothetical protein CWO91_34820 [Bradyrhizobium genosp. SA-3]